VWVDGSFVTDEDDPQDVDGCWEYAPSLDVGKLDPVFLHTDPPRQAMKTKYGVDFLISWTALAVAGDPRPPVEEFFQTDRHGNRKGIILPELGEHL
jgi:hypothetical protein